MMFFFLFSFGHDSQIKYFAIESQKLTLLQREQAQHDSLAHTLQSLRTEASHTQVALSRLQRQNEDAKRQIAAAEARAESARTAQRTAEATARGLRDEVQRQKNTVAQVRAACATDIRRRDVQISRLKGHLVGQQRGSAKGVVGSSITISPAALVVEGGSLGRRDGDVGDGSGIGKVKKNGSVSNGNGGGAVVEPATTAAVTVDDPAYSLQQETTEFLTQLSQGLSDENDALIVLVRSTIATLSELQGLSAEIEHAAAKKNEDRESDTEDHDNRSGNESGPEKEMLQALPTSVNNLSQDMDRLLESLRALLTSPNFVPIDEVTTREEELIRLRDGWEKMEARWREAIVMMGGWRKRMLNGGDTVNLEELKVGLTLGEGLGGIVKPTPMDDEDHSHDELDDSQHGDAYQSELMGSDAALPSSSDIEGPLNMRKGLVDLDGAFGMPLKETNANVSPRKVSFANDHSLKKSGKDESPRKLTDDTMLQAKGIIVEERYSNGGNPIESRLPRKVSSISTSRSSVPSIYLCEPYHKQLTKLFFQKKKKQIRKRPSSPSPLEQERSPKLTVQDKLQAAKADADAAAATIAAATQKARDNQEDKHADGNTRKKTPLRKTRIVGRPRRRKSTLSPEELAQLITGS